MARGTVLGTHCLAGIRQETDSIEESGKLVTDEMQQKFGQWGMLACLNGVSVMEIAQEIGLTLPGGLKPSEFDIWHEYIAHAEFGRGAGVGFRNGIAGKRHICTALFSGEAQNRA